MLKLHTLGPFELCRQDGHPLPKPATLKSQSLLAFLACHQAQLHLRETLIGMFWGDRPERKARRSLSTALWHIRRCLPDENTILSDGNGIQFNPETAVWLDVQLFIDYAAQTDIANLQAALALYKGHFLDGFFDDWILSERYRLESLYADVLAKLMIGHEAAGVYGEALATAIQLLDLDPLREDAHRVAMRVYCHLGQRNAALKQYERCCQLLLDELAIEPMAETRDLWQAICDGRFACQTQVTSVSLRTPAQHGQPRGYNPFDTVARVPLVGREQEITYLTTAWQAAQANQCSLVLISGEAGIGKTRLVGVFTNQQSLQGSRILLGRCYEFERLLPYQPFTEALRLLPSDLAVAVAAELPQWTTTHLSHLLPELLAQRAELTSLPTSEGQTRLFESISQFLSRLAVQEPLLFILEDLHWATDSVLQLLHYLARHLISQPLLIVGTFRPEAISPAHPLATVARRLDRDRLARRLQLTRLSKTAVAELIVQMSGAGQSTQLLAERLFQETEGNPFYLIETVKALFEQDAIRLEDGVWWADFTALSRADLPLPASIEETIQARIDRLSEKAQEIVQVAAVVGKTFDYDLLQEAWGQGELTTLAALDDLLRQRLVSEEIDSSEYAFTHHKIQEVVYQDLPRHHRLHLHGQIGMYMETISCSNLEEMAGELGYHFEQACLLDEAFGSKAVIYLQQAGDHASGAYAHQEAIAFYQRAIDLLDFLSSAKQDERFQQQSKSQLLEKIADIYRLIGEIKKACFAFKSAIQNTLPSERIRRAQLNNRIATIIGKNENKQASHLLNSADVALGNCPLEPVDEWWVTWLDVQMQRAMLHYWRNEPQELNDQVHRLKPLVYEHGIPEQKAWFFGLLGNSGLAIERWVPSSQTIQYCRDSLAATQQIGDLRAVANAQKRLAFALLWLNCLEEAEELICKCYASSKLAGIKIYQIGCLTHRAILYRKRQNVVQTAQFANQSLEICLEMQEKQYAATALGSLAWVAWREGDVRQAEKHGHAALEIRRKAKSSKGPFLWILAWPLIGVALADNNIAKAIDFATLILNPAQQRLPEEMTAALQAAITAWNDAQSELARNCLEKAAVIAVNQGYL